MDEPNDWSSSWSAPWVLDSVAPRSPLHRSAPAPLTSGEEPPSASGAGDHAGGAGAGIARGDDSKVVAIVAAAGGLAPSQGQRNGSTSSETHGAEPQALRTLRVSSQIHSHIHGLSGGSAHVLDSTHASQSHCSVGWCKCTPRVEGTAANRQRAAGPPANNNASLPETRSGAACAHVRATCTLRRKKNVCTTVRRALESSCKAWRVCSRCSGALRR